MKILKIKWRASFLEHTILEYNLLNMLNLKLKAEQISVPAKYLLLIFKYFD